MTALAVAREPSNRNQAELEQRARQVFDANFPNHSQYGFAPLTVVRDAKSVRVQTSGTVPTAFMRVLGFDTLGVGASSEVGWGSNKIEVALVLDNTGSMGWSGKMSALKSAAHDLLNTLEAASYEPGSVKVSIVPFNTQVKVGTAARSEPWLYFDISNPNTAKRVYPATWTGCVTDRERPNDATDAPAGSDAATGYWAANCAWPTLAEIRPLTDSFASLRTTIDQMTPVGNTNIAIGLAWGLATLSPRQPMTQTAEYADDDVLKFIVLLTDGDNTQNRWWTSSNAYRIDERTRAACDEVKSIVKDPVTREPAIKLYTIRVIEGNAALLQGCASEPGMYYDVQNVGQLMPAFQSIAKQITQLRLTH
jgi:Mg-chelatase subunit ChlD